MAIPRTSAKRRALARSNELLRSAVAGGRVPKTTHCPAVPDTPRQAMHVPASAHIGRIKPREAQEEKRAQIVEETRRAVAGVLGVPVAQVPTSWRRMARALHPTISGMRAVGRALDQAREARGYKPAVVAWFKSRGTE